MEALSFLAAGWAVVWTVVAVVVLTSCVAYERGAAALVVLIITAVVMEFFSGYSPLGWILESPGRALGVIAVYIAMGIVWSMIKWRLELADIREDLQGRYKNYANPSAHSPGYYGKEGVLSYSDWLSKNGGEYLARSNRDRILMWMAWWPFSALDTLLTDVLVRLWRRLFDVFEKTYDAIARSALGG